MRKPLALKLLMFSLSGVRIVQLIILLRFYKTRPPNHADLREWAKKRRQTADDGYSHIGSDYLHHSSIYLSTYLYLNPGHTYIHTYIHTSKREYKERGEGGISRIGIGMCKCRASQRPPALNSLFGLKFDVQRGRMRFGIVLKEMLAWRFRNFGMGKGGERGDGFPLMICVWWKSYVEF